MIAHIPILQGLRVKLRPPMEADVATRFVIGRHAEVVRAYGGSSDPAAPYTREDARREIEALGAEPAGWAIDVGGYIGQIRFHSMNRHDRRAALAIGIDDPGRHGQGLGSEAICLALGHGFGTGLHRVTLRVLASNERHPMLPPLRGVRPPLDEAAWLPGDPHAAASPMRLGTHTVTSFTKVFQDEAGEDRVKPQSHRASALVIPSGLSIAGNTSMARRLAEATGGEWLRMNSLEQLMRDAGVHRAEGRARGGRSGP